MSRNGRWTWAAPMLSGLIVLILGGLILSTYPKLSPVDELQHVDLAIKASQGRWYVPSGESVGQDAMRIQACDGIDAGWPTPPCETETFDPADFQELGINTGAGRPSLYYVVTGYLGQAISALTGAGFLLSARIVSLISLALGGALITWTTLRLSRSPLLAVSLGVMTAALPPVLSQGIAVNPDAWSLLAGAAITSLGLHAVRLRPITAALLLTVAATTTVLIKPNFIVLAIVPIILLAVSWHANRLDDRAAFRRLAAAVFASAIASLTFLLSLIPNYSGDNRAQESTMAQRFALADGTPWPVGQALDDTLRNFVPMYQQVSVDVFEKTPLVGASVVVAVVLISGAVSALAMGASDSRQFALGLAGVLSLVATPALVYLGMYLSGLYFGYPQRYSLVVLPVLAIAWGALKPRQTWFFVATAFAILTSVLFAYIRL